MPGKVVSQDEWVAARNSLLEKEKENAKARIALSNERRTLPMVKVEKEYTFEGPGGAKVALSDLFEGHEQLIIYHYMFAPNDEEGCHGCAHSVACLPDLRHVRQRDTNLALVSRAPYAKIEAWKKKNSWTLPWYSSEASGFSEDFQSKTIENQDQWEGDSPGFDFFLKKDGEVYHTYSKFADVLGGWTGVQGLLDYTAMGARAGEMGPAEYKLNYEMEPLQ